MKQSRPATADPSAGCLPRLLAGIVAAAVSVFLLLYIAIVAAFGMSDSVRTAAAIIFGALILLATIAMWTLGRPTSLLGRTAISLALTTVYFGYLTLTG